MATQAQVAYLLISAATVIGGVVMLLWIGVTWLLSYSD